MVSDHSNYLTFEDPAAVNLVRRALKLAEAGDLYGAAETAGVDVAHAAVVSEGLRKGMRFSIGAEVDNDPRARPDAQNIVDAMRPDGIIRSIHFITIEHPEKGPDFQWAFDRPEFVELFDHVGTDKAWQLYIETLFDAIDKLPTHIVGHFYVPGTFGKWPAVATLEKYENQLLDICLRHGLAVEINARFLYRDNPEDVKKKYLDANRRLIRKAKAKGVPIAIGSDAHSPKDQGAGFGQILKLLDEARINELIFPIGGRLARVALRATKEHLERRAAVAVAPPIGSSITGFGRAELAELETKGGRRRGPRRTSAPARRPKIAAKRGAKKPARKAKTPARKTRTARGKTASRRSPAARRPTKKAARKTPSTRMKKSPRKVVAKKKTAPKKGARSAAKTSKKRPAAAKKVAKKKKTRRR